MSLSKKEDRWKAAFVCWRGLFEPTVMFFGLTNAPPTFQSMMEYYFDDYLREGWLKIYLDDPLIFSNDPKVHREREAKVVKRFQEHDLFLKTEKCLFGKATIPYLGYIISHRSVAMDPVKLAGILTWQIPTTVKGVRSFLGFRNFYRKFIEHYSEKAAPLHALTKKNQSIEWGVTKTEAFEALKKVFMEEVVLTVPNNNASYYMATDTLKKCTGGVLMQRDLNG